MDNTENLNDEPKSKYSESQKRAIKKYRENNRDKVNEQRKHYYQNKKKSDPEFMEYKRMKAKEYYHKKKLDKLFEENISKDNFCLECYAEELKEKEKEKENKDDKIEECIYEEGEYRRRIEEEEEEERRRYDMDEDYDSNENKGTYLISEYNHPCQEDKLIYRIKDKLTGECFEIIVNKGYNGQKELSEKLKERIKEKMIKRITEKLKEEEDKVYNKIYDKITIHCDNIALDYKPDEITIDEYCKIVNDILKNKILSKNHRK